ncbi:hypothetical protein CLF_113634 [Clonorchis sinensis]|uniref:Uncharacterized protein n=1 Tax=Clonorchis sinensis TaxID=79923 RepID=G7YYX0_CLOSI|nr:hypothetical protein CLF_113634 [Clonorchis sinensis]
MKQATLDENWNAIGACRFIFDLQSSDYVTPADATQSGGRSMVLHRSWICSLFKILLTRLLKTRRQSTTFTSGSSDIRPRSGVIDLSHIRKGSFLFVLWDDLIYVVKGPLRTYRFVRGELEKTIKTYFAHAVPEDENNQQAIGVKPSGCLRYSALWSFNQDGCRMTSLSCHLCLEMVESASVMKDIVQDITPLILQSRDPHQAAPRATTSKMDVSLIIIITHERRYIPTLLTPRTTIRNFCFPIQPVRCRRRGDEMEFTKITLRKPTDFRKPKQHYERCRLKANIHKPLRVGKFQLFRRSASEIQFVLMN